MIFVGWKKLYLLAGRTFSYQEWYHIRFTDSDPNYSWMEQNGYIVYSREYTYTFTDKFIKALEIC